MRRAQRRTWHAPIATPLAHARDASEVRPRQGWQVDARRSPAHWQFACPYSAPACRGSRRRELADAHGLHASARVRAPPRPQAAARLPGIVPTTGVPERRPAATSPASVSSLRASASGIERFFGEHGPTHGGMTTMRGAPQLWTRVDRRVRPMASRSRRRCAGSHGWRPRVRRRGRRRRARGRRRAPRPPSAPEQVPPSTGREARRRRPRAAVARARPALARARARRLAARG